eukprot:TRINITY_DN2078_c0_g3_i4.p1 TRINITY_DN2078_c0_g3~~TRINITY_DN2078_c0_g3_i4.p1  ORF type:complete len:101 (-),score=18.94 TRINITY_DN2078_c0_g3_i4:245-547(-)
MGRLFVNYLDAKKIYVCTQCRTHLANCSDIISRTFQARHGRAYLMNNVYFIADGDRINAYLGPVEEKMLLTGMHKTCDLFCKTCDTLIGWRYVKTCSCVS